MRDRLADHPEAGSRVSLNHRVDPFPKFSVPAGVTGTINEVTDRLVSIKLDNPVPGAEGHDNCLHFYDSTAYGDPTPTVGTGSLGRSSTSGD